MDNKPGTFENLLLNIPDELIAGIFQQAWGAAQVEAIQLLKEKMLQAILERSYAASPGFFNQPDGHSAPVVLPSVTPVSASATPVSPPSIAVSAPSIPVLHGEPAPNAGIKSPVTGPLKDVKSDKEAEDAESIRKEIESIRQKLSQNEQALQKIKTPPGAQPDPAPVASPLPAVSLADGAGYYVYCVKAIGSEPLVLPAQGIDDAYPLFLISTGTLQAIVSRVSLDEYGESALDLNLHTPAWLEAKVYAHQNLLSELSQAGNIVPMRFCTIYLSEERVRAMLDLYNDTFLKSLAYLSGRQEWGVKAYYDQALLTHYIETNDATIQALKTDETGKTEGQAYFTRKKLAQTILDQVERASDACAQNSHNRLSACAVAACLLRVQTKEASGREEEMAFNAAYLIEKENIDQFRSELEKLGAEYGASGFSFDFTGPWPPYNFANITPEESLDE